MKKLCVLLLAAPLLLVADDSMSVNQALNQIEADEQAAINQAAANQAAADQAAENQAAQNQSENDQSTVYDPDNPAQLEVNSDVVAPGAYVDPYSVDPYREDPYRRYNNENRYEDHHMENQYQDRHLENADNPYRDNHQYENRNMNQERREDRSMERPNEGMRGRR